METQNTYSRAEVRFANYGPSQSSTGAHHLEQLITGLVLNIAVTLATINSGLPNTAFALNN